MVGLSTGFSAEKYPPECSPSEFANTEPITEIHSVIRITPHDDEISIVYQESGDIPPFGHDHCFESLEMVLSDWSACTRLVRLIRHHEENEFNHSRTFSIEVESVDGESQFYNGNSIDDAHSGEDFIEDTEVLAVLTNTHITFALDSSLIGTGVHAIIPYGKKFSPDNGTSDFDYLHQFEDLLAEATEDIVGGPELTPVIGEDEEVKLGELEYGQEVFEHIEDGDASFIEGRRHLAMSSYIHAFEWAAITYLKTKGVDIIEKENDGQYFYFAGKDPNLLEKLQNHVTIDQTTTSKLESMNRAERRWMAHHKSGDVLSSEVIAIRDRLREFITTLFGE